MGKYGIIIKGKDRHIQIDSFNTVMNCIRKQTVVMKGGIVSGNQGYYTELPITPHLSTKLFAVSPNNVFVKVIGGAIKGSDKISRYPNLIMTLRVVLMYLNLVIFRIIFLKKNMESL